MFTLPIRTLLGLVAVLALALVLPASASAKAKPITGKLSKRGYEVIALDASGKGKSVRAKRGKFKLRPPASRVTLHLRAKNGSYAGPIVVGRKGKKRVIVGVKAGASLGKVKVNPGEGFASAKGVAKTSLDTKRTATAKKGVPIGAGNFGRVAVAKLMGPGSDRDLDGVPTSLDIDDDGDLILDDVDPDTARAAGATKAQEGNLQLRPFTGLLLGGPQAPEPSTPRSAIVNANAPGLSDEQIQSGLRAQGTLQLQIGSSFNSAELDCGSLVYCSAGGTGRLDRGGNPGVPDPNPEPFPACCDPDKDGLGSLRSGPWPGLGLLLRHGAGADQIRGGDLLIARDAAKRGEQPELAGTLETVFATVPALASYTDELGTTHVISYPLPPHTILPVVDGPDAGSEVSVSLNFWRPQRQRLPEEGSPGNWIDIGGLLHFAHVLGVPTTTYCPQSSYSAVEDELIPSVFPGFPGTPAASVFLYRDRVGDQGTDPPNANTFTYTLNLSQCRASRGGTFNSPGQQVSFAFEAALSSAPVNTATSIYNFEYQ